MPVFSSANEFATSIRITPSEVTILKVDKQVPKIVGLYQQPLRPGVITQEQVADPKALEAAIKTALAHLKAAGSKIILGFPENKTYTTTLEITDVPDKDLGDAVRWQAADSLPSEVNSLYFDWQKITPKSTEVSSNHQILLVSAPKSFIDPLIDSVVNAGAIPVSCEPTSTSLARLAPEAQVAVIAEVRKTDSTLILVDERKIVRLSTVVTDPGKIAGEIKRMNNFFVKKYQKTPSTIYVCGEGATSEWLQYLKTQTSMKLAQLPLPPLKNLPPNPTSFAVSLSLAQKDPAPPKSPNTINLLPGKLEQEYQQVAERKSLSFGFKASLAVLILTVLIMFAGFVSISLRSRQIRTQISAEEQNVSQTSYAQLARNAESANTQARILTRLPVKDNLSVVRADLTASVPQGMSISSYTIDLPEKVLLIAGLAPTRDDLLKFKDNLESQSSFRLVTIPLPTLESQTNIQFSIAVDLTGAK